VVGVIYAAITPVLEKPDEGGHYGYLLYLREQRTLPPMTRSSGIWTREFKQPPLYYGVTAVLTSWLPNTPDVRQSLADNPYMWESVQGNRNDNRNRYLHPPDMTPLFLGARLVSMLFGLGCMIAAYFLARLLFDKNTGVPIATAILVGFQPQFVYITTAINNDTATAFWGALIVTLLIYRLKRGNVRLFAGLMGGLLGLACLTKVSALVFFPLVGLGLLLVHRGPRRAFVRDGITVVIVAFVIAGWWYLRNLILYNDPLTLGAHNMVEPALSQTTSWKEFRHTLFSIEYTFWANQSRVFISPIGLDHAMIWWGRISLVLLGLGIVFQRNRWRDNLPVGIVLLSWPVLYLILLIGYWTQKFPWSIGRLLFPAIAPIALLFVVGWYWVSPLRWRRSVLTFSAGTVMLASCLIPFVSLYPLYHPSREWQVEQVQHPVETIYTDSKTGLPIARLIGYNLPQPYGSPGEYLPIELCWEPLGQTQAPYTMFVQLLDLSQINVNRSPAVWGRRETYPGLGSRPTDRWALHKAFCDPVFVQVFPEAPTPLGAAIEVGFIDPNRQERLLAVDKQGDPVDLATVGGVPILSSQDLLPKDNLPPEYWLDDAIGLSHTKVDASNSLTLTLTWQSYKKVPYDATILVHLIGTDGSIVSQVDRQPLDGRFPTSYWLPGQIITDVISLPMPKSKGPLTLNVGMYLWPSMQRLPVKNVSDQPVRDDMIVVDVPQQ
jgi:4-amino-4-deoxy-L-arabinose transferase-like glycosyltransferase